MPSEQKQLLFDENQATLKKHYDVENNIVDTIRSVIKPEILESSFHYKLKNVKIDLPKINIPNEVLLKHEVDKYRKLFQHKSQTARKSINMKTGSCTEEGTLLHKSEKVEETGIKMSAKVLSFNCLKCQDSTRYSPNDLQKHFQMWHQGELPSYPCEMCNFSASDFQLFKLHRRIHRGTSVKCDICNDEKIYTLLDLTKHFISTHCVNGSFQCEKCTFSTLDVGTFVQHIHRHNDVHYKSDKYHHVYLSRGEMQKHPNNVHSVTFPFNCKYCRFGTSKREYLVRHVLTLHKEHLYAKEKLEKDKYEKRMAQTSVGLKLVLKRYKIGTSRKIFWKRKKINNESDQSIEQNTEVLKNMNKTQANSEDQSCLTQEHLNEERDERLHCENNDKTAESESEKQTLLSTGQYNKAGELSNVTSGSSKTAVQGPTVVTVKNNRITVPANYSAKFMGFKMVDGKQHIVIKLLPTIKQNLCSPSSQSDAAKDSTANLQLPSLDSTGFLTRVKTEKDSVSSNQTAGGEQKEPDSSRDALPFLLDDMMPANEIVVTSTATSESSEEPVHASVHSEARLLRCKTNCTIGRSFNKQKTSPQNFSRIKTHVRSKDSVSRNRNCKRKCRDSYQEPPRKTTLHRKCKEKVKPEDVHESFGFSRTRLSKDSVRTLRLFPFSSKQLVKCPRRNQPVVVLNHPDADAPEVVNVMKTISKFNGHVLKVSLSERTLSALLKPVCYKSFKTTCDFSKRHKTLKPISSVKERFVLKLTLKKTSKNNYRIVKTTSENVLKATFNCWFCGRVFDNQDAWAGHGQRHLMEATRDWNMIE
ncbi:zinc finger protein 518A isoform X3 [Pipistrellus kuhlii]|uniref:zinc finger protein 518A isoform X3 n=1 Tax=Pipistrellus kuhlii TaxID=59472 RepID=UPI00174F12CC|nr:zinc finger protein 518A isoform X3 [Pipistrellus kuhlii]